MGFLRTKKGKITVISAAVVAAAAVAVILILTLGGEKGWRSISVSELFGRVSASNGNSSYDAYREMKLFDGYSLETDPESWSRLVLDDEKYIKLEENSLARFEKLGGIGSDSTAIRLERGAMTNELTKPLGDDAQYVVNTPNAVLAVRGTYFRVEVSFSDSGEAYSDVYVYGGAVSCHRVMPDGTPVDEDVEIRAGYKARIKMDEIITVYVEEKIDEGEDDVDPIDIADIPDGDIVGMYDASRNGHELFLHTRQIWEEITGRGIDIGDYTSQYDGGEIPAFSEEASDIRTEESDPVQTSEVQGISGGDNSNSPGNAGNPGNPGNPGSSGTSSSNGADNAQTGTPAVSTERTEPTEHTEITQSTQPTQPTQPTEPTELTPSPSGTEKPSASATGRATIGVTSATPSRSTVSTKKESDREEPVIMTEEPDETSEMQPADSVDTAESPEPEKPQETSTATTSSVVTTTTTRQTTEFTRATTRRPSGGGGGNGGGSDNTTHTHIWETETIPSTCTAKGHRKVYCPECGTVKESEELPLAEHTPVKKTTPATCTESGSTVTTCSVCGAVIDTVEIPANGHTPVTEITQPTADKEGRKLVYCSVCETVISDETLPKFTLDISGGDIVITSTGYSIGGAEKIPYTDKYVITQSDSGGSITVESGTHEILLNDVHMTGGLTVKSGASVRLDCSDGCSITRDIKETALTVDGTLEFSSGSISLNAGTPVRADGEFTVSGGTLNAEFSGDCGIVLRQGNYIQTGGIVKIMQADGASGAGIAFGSGSFTVSGGSLDVSADTALDLDAASTAVTGGCIRLDGGVAGHLSNGVDALACSIFTSYPADRLNLTRGDGTAYSYGVTSADMIDGKYYLWLPGVEINADNFPDDVFRKYISDNFDAVSDGVLSAEECDAVTEIKVSGALSYDDKTLTSMTGIDYFPKLTRLSITSCNDLAELDVGGNPALEYLNIRWTGIASLDLSKNTALKTLRCSSSGVSSLNVSNNPALEELSCSNNNIANLDVSSCKALTKLVCGFNDISELDLTNNTALVSLDCERTSVSSLNLRNCTALTSLKCSNTAISSLDLSKNTALTELHIDGCPMVYIDLTVNTALEKFTAEGCSYPIPSNALIFDMSMFEGIDPKKIRLVSGAARFDESTCRFTGITDTVTYTYDCGGGHSATFTLPRSGEPIDNSVAITAENFQDEVFRNYISTNFDTDNDGVLSENEIAAVTEIRVSGNPATDGGITSLAGIDNFTNLTTINCRYNIGLTDIDISRNTGLKQLYCDSTGIKSLDVSSNTELTNLWFAKTAVSEFKYSSLDKLQSFMCSGTKLASLPLNDMPVLRNLGCGDMQQITSLDVSMLPELVELTCENTGITSLDLSHNPELYNLWIYSTKIPYIDLTQNPRLKTDKFLSSGCRYPISRTATEFDMNTIPGIDISRITYTGSTASYDSSTGIFSNINGNITYTYDCGNGLTADFTLTRTL